MKIYVMLRSSGGQVSIFAIVDANIPSNYKDPYVMTVTVCLISYLRDFSEFRGLNKNKYEIQIINYSVDSTVIFDTRMFL